MTEGSIILHPKLGVNPHLMVCTKCGKDTGEIALLGRANWVYTCKDCDMHHWGFSSPPKGGCQKCWSRGFTKREIEEHERMPGVCPACVDKQKACDTEVRNGGVYFRCEKCGSEGAIKAGHDLAARVREKSGIAAPKPVGLALDECPQCGKEGGGGQEEQTEGQPGEPGGSHTKLHAGGVQEGGV